MDNRKVTIERPTMLVCVSKTWGNKITSGITGKRVDLEDCARGYWPVKLHSNAKFYGAEWLMAFSRGVIVGVWKIRANSWVHCSKSPKKSWPEDVRNDSRIACELEPVSRDIWNRYVGIRVANTGLEPGGGWLKYSF